MLTARSAAMNAVVAQLRRWPDLEPMELDRGRLSPADARLAEAIYCTTVQRWLTLEFLVNRFARRKIQSLDRPLQAVLLTAAAQLLFMDKLPDYAVVNEAVGLAKRTASPAGSSLVNALLHRICSMVAEVRPGEAYRPAPDILPFSGGVMRLAQAWLPPVKTLDQHLAVATSHPVALVRMLLDRYGPDRCIAILLHQLQTPPTIVYLPPATRGAAAGLEPHEQADFYLWQAERGDLGEFLKVSGGWVQDPTASLAVAASRTFTPDCIADYCAGRGTKTRQLVLIHPSAKIIASDPHSDRLAQLEEAFAGHPRVRVIPHERWGDDAAQVDLLLLDVPCSNTGVLARRLEARYRYNPQSMANLIELQRQIIREAHPLLRPGATVIYSTCSIDPLENEEQSQYAAELYGLKVHEQQLTLPGGQAMSYHDGGYYAILR